MRSENDKLGDARFDVPLNVLRQKGREFRRHEVLPGLWIIHDTLRAIASICRPSGYHPTNSKRDQFWRCRQINRGEIVDRD